MVQRPADVTLDIGEMLPGVVGRLGRAVPVAHGDRGIGQLTVPGGHRPPDRVVEVTTADGDHVVDIVACGEMLTE